MAESDANELGRDAGGCAATLDLLKADTASRVIAASWRSLTGGKRVRDAARRTVVACSGGADSTALALALAAHAREFIVIAHVVHDLREPAAALADRDRVRDLAAWLGVGFEERHIEARATGLNLEAAARTLRYGALAEVARAQACACVVTGHTADDAAETLIMRLVRGAGPRGLAGIRAKRALARGAEGKGLWLVRPMLDLERADSEHLCTLAGREYALDATNMDTTRLRARVRRHVLPELRALSPGSVRRMARGSQALAEVAELTLRQGQMVAARAEQLSDGALRWDRAGLREQPRPILAETLRIGCERVGGERGLDRINARTLRTILAAIADATTDPRRYTLGPVRVEVTARSVTIEPRMGVG